MRVHLIGIAGFLAMLTTTAVAQQPRGAADAEATNGRVQRYDFPDHDLIGDRVSPNVETLTVRRQRSRDCLIRVRSHYIPELRNSVETL